MEVASSTWGLITWNFKLVSQIEGGPWLVHVESTNKAGLCSQVQEVTIFTPLRAIAQTDGLFISFVAVTAVLTKILTNF